LALHGRRQADRYRYRIYYSTRGGWVTDGNRHTTHGHSHGRHPDRHAHRHTRDSHAYGIAHG
jgi:hypothetical protein